MCKQRINILWCHRAILYEPWILSENGSIKELSSTKNSAKLRVVFVVRVELIKQVYLILLSWEQFLVCQYVQLLFLKNTENCSMKNCPI